MRVRRIANVSQLDAEERAGNALRTTVLGYTVRGHFLMSKPWSKQDKYGKQKHTTFYVPYKTLLRDLDDLPTELEVFDGNMRLHRSRGGRVLRGERGGGSGRGGAGGRRRVVEFVCVSNGYPWILFLCLVCPGSVIFA